MACLMEQVKRQVEGIGGLSLSHTTPVARFTDSHPVPKKSLKFGIKSTICSLLSLWSGRRRTRGRGRVVLLIQPILFDVRHYWRRQQIPHGEPSLQEQTDFGGRDVILNQLRDHVDVVSPPCKSIGRLVHVGSRTLDNEAPIFAEDVIQLRGRRHGGVITKADMRRGETHIRLRPNARLRHSCNQVRAGE